MDLLLRGLVLSNSSLHPVGVERNEGVAEKLVEESPPLVLVVKLLHLHVPLPLPLAFHKSERGEKRRKARKEQGAGRKRRTRRTRRRRKLRPAAVDIDLVGRFHGRDPWPSVCLNL